MLQILIGILSVFVSLYAWEYTALRKNFEYSPSLTINLIADQCIAFWKACGRTVAWLSSFLTIFDFADMFKAAERLLYPIFKIVVSWTHFFVAYVVEMNLYDHPILITIGSLLLLCAICYILYRFNLIPEKIKNFGLLIKNNISF